MVAPKVFVIAEAGVNHNGDLDLAKRLIDCAVDAGADAVKFQTFQADRLASVSAPKAAYQLRHTDADESQRDMLRRLELSREAHLSLKEHCDRRGIPFLSTPFDVQSADLLEQVGVPLFKLGSGEVTNLPLLEHVGRKKKPVILSTGMSYLEEVRSAVDALRNSGCPEITVLHCTTAYPSSPADANLRAMSTMAEALGVSVGLSDHTPGIAVAIAAAALGARVIEKHFTMDRNLAGPDHAASLEPGELAEMIRGVRVVERALGDGIKQPAESEFQNRSLVRRSLAAATPIVKGATIEDSMLIALRPGTGISPMEISKVSGRRSAHDVARGQLLSWTDLL